MHPMVSVPNAARSLVGAGAPVLVAAALVPFRDTVPDANVALALMTAVVAVAAVGGLPAGVAAGVTSALAFDFFHTRPYLSLRMSAPSSVRNNRSKTGDMRAMGDLIFVLVTLAFFGVCVAYVRACDRLVSAAEDPSETAAELADDSGDVEVAR